MASVKMSRWLRPLLPAGSLRHIRRQQTASRGSCVQPSAAGFTDYEHEKANFHLSIPDHYNYSVDVIDAWAAAEKSGTFTRCKPAFWWVGESGKEIKWNFTELSANSQRVSSMLLGQGLRPGDRVMVMLPKLPEWWLTALGAWRAGLVLLPATTQLTSRDILHRLHKAEPKCIIADAKSAEKVEAILKDAPHIDCKIIVSHIGDSVGGWELFQDLYNHADTYTQASGAVFRSSDPMSIFFTSGTTGSPKMTLHSHASYGAAHILSARYWMDQCSSDLMWNLSDTGWAKSAWFTGPWISGSGIFVHEAPFSAQHTLQVLRSYPVTTFCAPPTAYRMMSQEPLAGVGGQALRHCMSAGEPLNPEVIDKWRDGTGLWIREGYGQTETVLLCASSRCLPIRPGSMGKAAPGMDVRIIDDAGEEVASGQEGDIAVKIAPHRPPGLFLQYMYEPERTAAAFRGDYYVTGDRGRQDEDGYLWFQSRADDVIISAGYRIGPFEVESALIEHPAVAESAVVSSPDPTRGEVVKAFIILTKEAANSPDKESLAREIQDHVKTTTAPYKYPRKIEFVSELPKTVSGKIRRVELRNKEWHKAA